MAKPGLNVSVNEGVGSTSVSDESKNSENNNNGGMEEMFSMYVL